MRKRIYDILEIAQPGDRVSRRVDVFIFTLISLNILAVVLESVNELSAQYGNAFFWFEIFSVGVFTIEYLLRCWSCVEYSSGRFSGSVTGRVRYSLTPAALVDLLAILPFYLSMFFSLDLRFLRVLRLLRIFKLTRYSSAMSLLLRVLRDEAQAFGAAFSILFIIMVFAASGIYLFEHQAQPEAFSNIPEAVWWSVATLTTVGYGDAVPITVGGRIFGVIIMIIGVGIVALPAGILASAFSEQMRQRRVEYEDLAETVLQDGKVTTEEQLKMEQARARLGLRETDAEMIFTHIARGEIQRKGICPHCRKPLFNRRTDDK